MLAILSQRRVRAGRGRDADLRDRYFEAGVGYYLTGRMTFFSHAVPLAGNLFHHALEMLLKGHLSATLTERQRRNLGHRLRRMWKVYKVPEILERVDGSDR